MTSSPTHLLRRSALQPGESLPSLLARLTRLNHYDPPSLLERLCLAGAGGRDTASHPLNEVTFERLATLADIEPTALWAATAHRFAFLLTPPGGPLGSLTIPGTESLPCLIVGMAQQLRPESSAQFCPDCLQAAPYHRLLWLPMVVSACLEHKRLLVSQCPDCHQPVTIRAVVHRHCNQCQADLTRVRRLSLSKDGLGLLSQSAIQSWLMGGSPPNELASFSLPERPPAVLYQVLDGIRLGLRNARPDWEYLHRIVGVAARWSWPRTLTWQGLDPAHVYRLCATAFKALLHWPEGFYEFLEEYPQHRTTTEKVGAQTMLGNLYSHWFDKKWRQSAFEFLREAFEQYLVDEYAGSFRQVHIRWRRGYPVRALRFAVATVAEAAQSLGLPLALVKRLARVGRLTPLDPDGPMVQRYEFVLRAQVLELRRQWREAISLPEAAWWLGVSVDVALDLARADLLAVKYVLGVEGQSSWSVSKQSIVDLWSAVMAKARDVADPPSGMVDLRQVAQLWEAQGVKAADILQLVVMGDLLAYRLLSSSALDELRFAAPDIQACIQGMSAKD